MSQGQDDPSFHERVQALFLQALEQPEAQRAGWLAQACGGDRKLADEVSSLLRHHRPQQTLIASSGTGPARLLVVRDLSSPTWTGPRRVLAVTLVLLAALAAGGVLVQHQVRVALQHSLEDHLVSLRQAGVTGLDVWMREVTVDAEMLATDADIVAHVAGLVQDGATQPGGAPGATGARGAPSDSALARRLDLICTSHGWLSWSVLRLSDTRVVAAGGPHPPTENTVGRTLTAAAHAELARLAQANGRVLPPHALGSLLEGEPPDGEPVVTLAAAIRVQDRPIAALAFQIPPDAAFTRILGSAGPGQGETIAFDQRGRLLSHSVHEQALRDAGQLSGPSAMLHVELRDPGVDLLAGGKPTDPLDTRPLTEAARHAVAGRDGVRLEPYRSYAGHLVVGAWTWLPDHDFGVVAEIPVEQAYAPLQPWRRVLFGLWAVLGASALALVALTIAIRRLRERVAELAELGQYHLERQLGAGGMGTVYLAHHALLRRPTAVKVLRPDQASDELVRRFEQEVQQTALLTHPNTIEIYDFGRTPERVFYYAMEFVDGLTLQRLVELEGRLPAGRAVHLLRQLCGSLAEAHARGLVHRDVKPQNVLVCERGGSCDFVKVLDFGLVKEVGDTVSEQTAPDMLLGTLLYLPPERLRGETAVGPRGDVYAVGATAFKLLTGRDVFTGATTVELCANILSRPLPRMADHGASDVPPALEALVLDCLARDPARRPADAGAVLAGLDALTGLPAWDQPAARRWWENNARRIRASAG